MGKIFEGIDDKLRRWLLAQPMFFVGTAPEHDGHVNISPKGMAGTFAVLEENRVAYLDYFGSGAETIAHLRNNGRIVIMMCAFTGPPKIVRLHGQGTVHRAGTSGYLALRDRFGKEREQGARAIIDISLTRIADSCGYSVPHMELIADRDILDLHQLKRAPEYYQDGGAAVTDNAESIDGLPALR